MIKKRTLIKSFKTGSYSPDKTVLPYTVFAEYYDCVLSYLNYRSWLRYIQKVFDFFNIQAKSILEIASGTGKLAHFLSRYYSLLASDNSDYMIQVMKNHYPELTVKKLDMKKFSLARTFDAILSFNDNVNYLQTENDLRSHFSCMRNHLSENGLFLFDCTPTYNIKKNFLKKPLIKKMGDKVIRWTTYLMENDTVIQVNIDILDLRTGEILREEHVQYIHSPDMLIGLLKESGFKKVLVFDGFTLNLPHTESEHFHIAALA